MSDAWLIASIALLPPLLVSVVAAGMRPIGERLVAVELAASLAVVLLIMLSFVFDQPSSIDPALALALLTLPGSVILALFQERWL